MHTHNTAQDTHAYTHTLRPHGYKMGLLRQSLSQIKCQTNRSYCALCNGKWSFQMPKLHHKSTSSITQERTVWVTVVTLNWKHVWEAVFMFCHGNHYRKKHNALLRYRPMSYTFSSHWSIAAFRVSSRGYCGLWVCCTVVRLLAWEHFSWHSTYNECMINWHVILLLINDRWSTSMFSFFTCCHV